MVLNDPFWGQNGQFNEMAAWHEKKHRVRSSFLTDIKLGKKVEDGGRRTMDDGGRRSEAGKIED